MIRVLAIDDEPLALQQIVAYINKVPFLELAAQCQSALEARKFLENDTVDAIFCDINMPDLNGMDFVKSLTVPPLVVFTTAYSEYAVEGFRVNAVDYLLKPFGLQDFQRAANRLKERLELPTAAAQVSAGRVVGSGTADTPTSPDVLFLKTDYRIVKVNISDIRYVNEKNGGAVACQFHAHTPLLHHQSQQNRGSQQKSRHLRQGHLPPHRRPVQGSLSKLP